MDFYLHDGDFKLISICPFQGGCCFAFKIEHVDEETGENVWYARHGGSNEPELPWFDNTCGKTVRFGLICVLI